MLFASLARYTASRAWVSKFQRGLPTQLRRNLCTTGKNDDKDIAKGKITEEEEDEFGLGGFELPDVEEEEEDIEAKLRALAEAKEDVTPELASEIVDQMVKSAARSVSIKAPAKGDIISAISPHTVYVLRASRISSNTVHAALSDVYVPPITKKVTAVINVPELKLSKPAEAALKYLAGPRVHGDIIKFSANKFPSMAENQALIVSQLDRLVLAAKQAVGETVDSRPLDSWEEVIGEVQRQAGEDILEAGGLSLLIGEPQAEGESHTSVEAKAAT